MPSLNRPALVHTDGASHVASQNSDSRSRTALKKGLSIWHRSLRYSLVPGQFSGFLDTATGHGILDKNDVESDEHFVVNKLKRASSWLRMVSAI